MKQQHKVKSKSKIICIFGKRGFGKSTLAKKLISTIDEVIVYDSVCEHNSGVFISSPEALLNSNASKIIYRPYSTILDDNQEFNLVCEIILKKFNGYTFLIEEVDLYANPVSSPKFFDRLIKIGRHFNISIVTTSRRPAEVSRLLTSQANEIHAFRITEKRDKDYLQNYMDITGIENLKIGECKQYIE